MKKLWIVLLIFFLSSNVFAHGGGLDGYGCHNNRKQGGYHCHRGALAGQYFSSKAEMLQALKKKGTDKNGQAQDKKGSK